MKPVEEFDRRTRIGAARVRVANVRREEFEEAIGGVCADGGDEGGGTVGEGDELVHLNSVEEIFETGLSRSSGHLWRGLGLL
jgi:hypothetical protein